MANISITKRNLLKRKEPYSKAGDLLLLFAILDRAEKVFFERRGNMVVPIAHTQKKTFEMSEFQCFLAGRWMNYYKKVCGIRHPAKGGQFSVDINGEIAEFNFEISPVGSKAFAVLTLLESTVRRRDCKDMLDHFERSTTPLNLRFLGYAKSMVPKWLGQA